jgi:GT2 family glycosyltransferase
VLTVFIATRNGAATLPRVLTAYTALLPPRGGWKLVIIDNGSDDGTVQSARSFVGRLPLTVLTEPRRGKNSALNAGLHELEGDLAALSDDDTIPEPDWLVCLRDAADRHPTFAIFGGRILPLWDAPPGDWVLEWVRTAPVFSITDLAPVAGPCEATRVWGPNMAIRAEWFRKGYRFDERLGPNGSAAYSMGGETEFTLRLAIAERIECWHCPDARVHHIIPAAKMTRAWILRRAFHLGRCVHRESRQHAAAGHPHADRSPAAIGTGLARALLRLASARGRLEARRLFDARWDLNLWSGCLYEALTARYEPQRPVHDVSSRA